MALFDNIEGYMFLLTLIRFVQSVRGHRQGNLGVVEGRTYLFVTFYRDGTIYFAVLVYLYTLSLFCTDAMLHSRIFGECSKSRRNTGY